MYCLRKSARNSIVIVIFHFNSKISSNDPYTDLLYWPQSVRPSSEANPRQAKPITKQTKVREPE